jgi:TolB-like protein
MTCSSSSSSRIAVALAFALACACSHAGPAARPTDVPPRLAILPPDNLSGAPVPSRELLRELEGAVVGAGIEVVDGRAVQEFLAAHRIRSTAGVDRATAIAARDELGVTGLLVTSIELYGAGAPPRLGVTIRLVAADDAARLLWMDGAARTGDDAPGLLRLGIVDSVGELEREIFGTLARSLRGYLGGGAPRAGACEDERRFRPDVAFRADDFDAGGARTVAVLPFVNQTEHPGAGDIVTLEVLRQLHARGSFTVLEPGDVWNELLARRVIMVGGVSLETARLASAILGVDLVVAGYVRAFAPLDGASTPTASFTVLVIDARSKRVVWQSTSTARGDEGVLLFNRGRVSTAPALACRLARPIADRLGGAGGARRLGPVR